MINEQYAGNAVRFFLKPVEVKWKSAEEGRPIFEDREFIEIHKPGSKNHIICRPAKDEDRQIYADTYKAFKAGEEQAATGTPVTEWPQIRPAQAAMLKHHKVSTVEQLAALSEDQATKMGREGFDLRKKAKAFIEAANNAGALSERMTTLEKKLGAKDGEIEELKATNAQLHQELEKLKEPKKRGRPRKQPQEAETEG